MTRQKLLSALGVAATCLGLYLLYRVVRRYDMEEIVAALASVPASAVILAVLFTLVSYVFLVGAEYLAVRYTRRPVTFARVAQTATAALGIGHSIGLSALSSGAVRYRMYSRAGLGLVSVGQIILFSGVTVALGLATLGGVALLWHGQELARLTGLSETLLSASAGIASLVILGYIALCAAQPGRVVLGRMRLAVPSLGLACGQVVFGSGYLMAIAGVLYVSLRSFTDTDFSTVLALYVGADISAVVGHVPGGWGLLEYIVTSALAGDKLLAGLIIFRAVYYLLPLALGVVIMTLDEFSRRRTSHRLVRSAALHH